MSRGKREKGGRKCFPPRLIVWRGANEKIYLVENENVALIAEIISIGRFLFSFLSLYRWDVRSFFFFKEDFPHAIKRTVLLSTCLNKLTKLFAIYSYVPFMPARRSYFFLYYMTIFCFQFKQHFTKIFFLFYFKMNFLHLDFNWVCRDFSFFKKLRSALDRILFIILWLV